MRKSFLFLMMILLVSGHSASLAGDEGADQAAAEAKMQAEMEAYMKLAQPGDHHKHLGATVGTWETAAKVWPAPGTEPLEMIGTMTSRWILDGRFVESVYAGNFMGNDFQGMGIDGYDNLFHKYVGTWRDTMGTMTMVSEGSCEEEGKVRTMIGEIPDPSGQMMKNRAVITVIDENTYKYESYMGLPDGSEFKNMELVATRKS